MRIKCGTLIRLKHTEFESDLTASINFINDKPEVYLRKYNGTHLEEL